MRLRTLIIVIALAVVTAGIAAAPAMAKDPSIPKLKQQLRHAKQQRERARDRAQAASRDLAGALVLQATAGGGSTGPAIAAPLPPVTMDQTLAATLLADGVVTADEVAAAQRRATKAKKLARRWTVKVRRLEQKLRTLRQIAEWNRRGQWKPLIAIACKKYGVSAAGLHRMMMLESGGRRTVGSDVQGSLPVLPEHLGRQLEPLAAREHLQRLGADPRHRLRPQQRHGPEPVAQHLPDGVLRRRGRAGRRVTPPGPASPRAPAACPCRGTPPALRFLPQLTPGSARRVTTAARRRP